MEEDSVVDFESLPEFRIYASSEGGEPVVWDIRGKPALDKAIDAMTERYPHDFLHVREVFERNIMTINPRMPTA